MIVALHSGMYTLWRLPNSDRSLTIIRRWLVHSIATYYGLETWSVTKGSPARREAYIGLKDKAVPTFAELPRPLYVLV